MTDDLLLDVWKEACRHIRIGESFSRIAARVAQDAPVAFMAVRRLDAGAKAWETVAGFPEANAPVVAGITRCDESAWLVVRDWCRRREVLQGDAGVVAARVPGLVGETIDGDLLAGGLVHEGEPVGAVLLVAPPKKRLTRAHRALAQALLEPLAVALENDHRVHELTKLREAAEADRRSLLSRLGRQDIADTIVGAEGGLRETFERVDQVARSDTPVLILGETGTGKEVVARAIHLRSRRAEAPFLRVNCGAIPAELIDSELFGHERGSFTGAVAQRQGWFERADGGTLFLDEVGELPLAAQVRFLRILQDGSFQRVGGQRTMTADVRVVAATNRDLYAMVREGSFREDLWYRIAVFPVRLPALRERTADIPALARHFALRAAQRLGLPARVPSPADENLLAAYPWPGNVRELGSVLERAAILGDGRTLEVARALGSFGERGAVPASPALPAADRIDTLDAATISHIEAALIRTRGRVEGPNGAAHLLAINPHTLRARMRKLGIDWQRFRD